MDTWRADWKITELDELTAAEILFVLDLILEELGVHILRHTDKNTLMLHKYESED